jgi:hypothetical protein
LETESKPDTAPGPVPAAPAPALSYKGIVSRKFAILLLVSLES